MALTISLCLGHADPDRVHEAEGTRRPFDLVQGEPDLLGREQPDRIRTLSPFDEAPGEAQDFAPRTGAGRTPGSGGYVSDDRTKKTSGRWGS